MFHFTALISLRRDIYINMLPLLELYNVHVPMINIKNCNFFSPLKLSTKMYSQIISINVKSKNNWLNCTFSLALWEILHEKYSTIFPIVILSGFISNWKLWFSVHFLPDRARNRSIHHSTACLLRMHQAHYFQALFSGYTRCNLSIILSFALAIPEIFRNLQPLFFRYFQGLV